MPNAEWVGFFDQNPIFMPTSIFRAAPAAVGWRKNGDVITPEYPTGLTMLKRFDAEAKSSTRIRLFSAPPPPRPPSRSPAPPPTERIMIIGPPPAPVDG